ncbi:DNA-binding transcription factor, zf-fungal binuclear cluster type Klf1 [Schizosaccharomyces osmophilus]|uniref:DNA-binding transcription factor, zf-fungal binuclear cluster type Klf1 n=1 Tax=Schizosaccharomyces osmophilus TaxID=2545709 RepID=A0AAE9W6D9_9SCHI|nr:DNA-binding transcription factor, zf-fungal binuclear cluster type Klf1 [Schizosaccharomyces osmophilus]WBW70784.1 DNA-binding transcription factor, zf-fungal binuclear cluster type Klf1 [Schizosaccharomyces osmophilus]
MTRAKKRRAYQEGDIRYNCNYQDCDKSFTRKEHARRHFQSHINPKSFLCPHCGSSFTRNDILNRHVHKKHFMHKEGRGQILSNQNQNQHLHLSSDQEFLFPSYVESEVQDPTYTSLLSRIPRAVMPVTFHEGLPSSTVQLDTDSTRTPSQQNDLISASNSSPKREQHMSTQPVPYMIPPLNGSLDNILSPQDSMSVFGTSSSNDAYQQDTDNFVCWLFDSMEKDAPVESASRLSDTFNFNNHLDFMHAPDSTIIDFLNSNLKVDDKIAAKNLLSLPAYSLLIQVLGTTYRLTEDVLEYMNLDRVNCWISDYWRHFHPRWPFLHRATLKLDEAPVELLLAMITMGMHFTGDAFAFDIAVFVHSTLRFSIYIHPNFNPPASLWVYQALLIVEIFEKMTSTLEQHNLSQIFHGVTIESLQKGLPTEDTVTSKTSGNMSGTVNAQQKWRRWVDQEAIKRIAFFSFVLDSQHVILFGYRPLVDITSLGLPLLCEESLWNAASYEDWIALVNERDPPHFFPILKIFLKNENLPPKLTPWNMMIVLHGLTVIGWILGRNNLGMVESIMQSNGSNLKNCRTLLKSSYKFWLCTYRMFFLNDGTLPLNHPYVRGCLATYELAYISLHTNIVALQTYVKSTAFRSKRLCASTSRYIFAWMASDNSNVSIKHSVDMVEAFLGGDMEYNINNETGLHRPWCLYIVTLILWAYGYLSDARCELVEPGNDNYKSQLNTYLMQLRTSLSETPKDSVYIRSKTLPLLKCVIDVLRPARWGLLADGVQILSKLTQVQHENFDGRGI